MKIEISKEDLINLLESESLQRMIAEIIVEKMTDQQWDEYNKSLLDAFKRADKEIINTYISDYYAGDPRNRIKTALERMDKCELIELLKTP